MTIELKTALQPTQEIDGVRYYDIRALVFLGAAVSDRGRDFYVSRVGVQGNLESIKASQGARELIEGDPRLLSTSLEERFKEIQEEYPDLPEIIVARMNFSYREPRAGKQELELKLGGDYSDVPQDAIGGVVGFGFTPISKFFLEQFATDGFLGEVGGKLTGLELTYFSSRYVTPSAVTPYGGDFYLHSFSDGNGHLVSWKTGIQSRFQRGGRYTIIGGTVKKHDGYNPKAPVTIISRAKFFDHQTGDKYEG